MSTSRRPTLSRRGQHAPFYADEWAAAAHRRRRGRLEVTNLARVLPEFPVPVEFWDAIGRARSLAPTASGGAAELRLAVVDYFADRRVGVEIDDVWITTGFAEGLRFVLEAVADPGDRVLVAEPLDPRLARSATEVGVAADPLAATAEGSLPDARQIERQVTRRTRAIVIANPTFPTGRLVTQEELFMLARVCRRRGLFLIVDESRRDFVYDGSVFHSVLTLPEVHDRVAVLDSFSTRLAVPGARLGFVVTRHRRLVRALLGFAQARVAPPTLGQLGACAALPRLHRFLPAWRDELQRRRDLVLGRLAAIADVRARRPAGGFTLAATLPVRSGRAFCRWLANEFEYERRAVVLPPADECYLGHRRGADVWLSFTAAAPVLTSALDVLARALESYQR